MPQLMGKLYLAKDAEPSRMQRLAELVEEHSVPLRPVKNGEEWEVLLSSVQIAPEEEEIFKSFLAQVGKELTGLLFGEFEVWWPFAIESGPQKWRLEADGRLLIYESDIVWAEPEVFES